MEAASLLDLICGPVGPLPEAHQRYRLVSHLATGGQAEVFRAVRLSGGISSAPLTVKVFRPGDDRPVADQLRSWDKGDAVLMDLNSRGVPGICRRADGFFGPPPHPPGEVPQGDPVPYQVLDYLHGVTVREYVAQRYGLGGQQGPRLDAVAALITLAEVLQALHLPDDSRATSVLHMDVKPANVMVLTTGEVRLIDFTGARYYGGDHITTVAYTPGAGGPEASRGEVGPSYDVHGFGAVAYYLVTGEFPRHKDLSADGGGAPPARGGGGGPPPATRCSTSSPLCGSISSRPWPTGRRTGPVPPSWSAGCSGSRRWSVRRPARTSAWSGEPDVGRRPCQPWRPLRRRSWAPKRVRSTGWRLWNGSSWSCAQAGRPHRGPARGRRLPCRPPRDRPVWRRCRRGRQQRPEP